MPAARRTSWPQAHQRSLSLECSTRAPSPGLGSLLWAELGDMSKGRAGECPRLEVEHSLLPTGKNPGCCVCLARMVFTPLPNSLSHHSCPNNLDTFSFPSPPPPPCALQAKSTVSAGATRPHRRQAHEPPRFSVKPVPVFVFHQESIIRTRNPHVQLCHFLIQSVPGSRDPDHSNWARALVVTPTGSANGGFQAPGSPHDLCIPQGPWPPGSYHRPRYKVFTCIWRS